MPAEPANLASRLWREDVSLWPGGDSAGADGIADRLGWLHSIGWMQERADELMAWARGVVEAGDYDRVVLLGMGGASLAPAVFASLFPVSATKNGLPLSVLDTTEPTAIARIEAGGLGHTLFIVAGKSGDTVETTDLHDYFRFSVGKRAHPPFVIITDAGSPLHHAGENEGAAKIFLNPPDIGGRYSALSYFGLVPAALAGVDVGEILRRAAQFCATTKSDDPAENLALALGLLLGRAGRDGRDKLILHLPDGLGVFGLWVEQLIAESTGKDGKGLLPVLVGDGMGGDGGGEDRVTVRVVRGGAEEDGAGRADCTLSMNEPLDIGVEFFRWEFATAVAAACIGVNPFDQPDVASSKTNTRMFLEGSKCFPTEVSMLGGKRYELGYFAAADAGDPAVAVAGPPRSIKDAFTYFHRYLTPGCYLALLAYLPEDPEIIALLRTFSEQAAARLRLPVTVGFGPRYLHSTGQLHKGGPPTGRFIQFVSAPADMSSPTRDYTFAELHRAQADGDFTTLAIDEGAPIMHVDLKADRLPALKKFVADFTAAKR